MKCKHCFILVLINNVKKNKEIEATIDKIEWLGEVNGTYLVVSSLFRFHVCGCNDWMSVIKNNEKNCIRDCSSIFPFIKKVNVITPSQYFLECILVVQSDIKIKIIVMPVHISYLEFKLTNRNCNYNKGKPIYESGA